MSIILSREQVVKLFEVANNFKDIKRFTIEHSFSEIGTGVVVRFDLFEPSDTKVDITDYQKW